MQSNEHVLDLAQFLADIEGRYGEHDKAVKDLCMLLLRRKFRFTRMREWMAKMELENDDSVFSFYLMFQQPDAHAAVIEVETPSKFNGIFPDRHFDISVDRVGDFNFKRFFELLDGFFAAAQEIGHMVAGIRPVHEELDESRGTSVLDLAASLNELTPRLANVLRPIGAKLIKDGWEFGRFKDLPRLRLDVTAPFSHLSRLSLTLTLEVQTVRRSAPAAVRVVISWRDSSNIWRVETLDVPMLNLLDAPVDSFMEELQQELSDHGLPSYEELLK